MLAVRKLWLVCLRGVIGAGLMFLSLVSAAAAEDPGVGAAASAPPNILLILIDDMGFNDLGANGNPSVTTPNLDQLAAQGIRFTRHYTDATCTVTRVGILTGTEPAAHGFRPVKTGISPEVVTLPEVLKRSGYSTHHIGKWHLGYASELAWPLAQGFDTFFGFLDQSLLAGPHPPSGFHFGRPTYHDPWLQKQNDRPSKYRGHLSEILLEHALGFLGSQRGNQTPWFLNFWTYAPHSPLQPADTFASRYPATPEGRYRAFLEQVDSTVGQLMAGLEKNGFADNTLVIVASDNGGTNRQIDNNYPYFGTKTTFFEGGVRTPLIIRWPGHTGEGVVFDQAVTHFDYFPTIAAAAGADSPGQLIGRDLLEVVKRKAGLERNVYWETGNPEAGSWSVLSSDQKWRLHQYLLGGVQLNDLEERPQGDRDVAGQHPDIVARMREEYLTWHREKRLLDLAYQPLTDRGQAILSGDSLQRAPGFAGHTFAIGIVPEAVNAGDVHLVDTPGMIAFQQNQWQLLQRGPVLELDLNGIRLQAPAPPDGECSTIVVTSHFEYSPVFPAERRALVQLYINGRMAADSAINDPRLPPDDYLNATYIGQDNAGAQTYHGRLGRPVILNEWLHPAELKPGGIADLETNGCPPQRSPDFAVDQSTARLPGDKL
ncbi:MAG: sulfatase-like hydrolase/transferase [Halieaceae bacterium]|nr:sulfatase-like hydrolase/transferase [Halieaceae bacterium]